MTTVVDRMTPFRSKKTYLLSKAPLCVIIQRRTSSPAWTRTNQCEPQRTDSGEPLNDILVSVLAPQEEKLPALQRARDLAQATRLRNPQLATELEALLTKYFKENGTQDRAIAQKIRKTPG